MAGTIGKTLYDLAAAQATLGIKVVRYQTGSSSSLEYQELSMTLIGYDGTCLYFDTETAENKIIPMSVVQRLNPGGSWP